MGCGSRWRCWTTAACFALVTGVGATSAAANSDIAVVSRVTPVSALKGWTLWSAYAGTAGYRLTALDPLGAVSTLPIKPRKVPFDVDLGMDGRGRVVATYSRCRTEATAVRQSTTYLPIWIEGKRCDIYQYDFLARQERKLTAASTSSASEVLPSRWGDRLAFVRVAAHRHGTPFHASLYVEKLGRHATFARLPGGPIGRDGTPGPTGVDLQGETVAFAWGWRSVKNPNFGNSQIQAERVSGARRFRKRVGHGLESSAEYHSPVIDLGHLYFAEEGYDHPAAFHRVTLTGRHETQRPAPLYVVGLAVAGGTTTIDLAPGDPTTGASQTCVGYHTPVIPPDQTKSTGCQIQVDMDIHW